MKNRILLIVSLILISLVLMACNNTINNDTSDYVLPNVTGSETVTLTYDGSPITLTKEQIYKQVKYYGGISLLLQCADEILLSEIIPTITTDSKEYINRYNRIKYSTINESEVLELSGDASKEVKLEKQYQYTMYLMGLDTLAKQQAYIKFLAARDVYAKTKLKDLMNDKLSDFYTTDETLKSFYENNYYNNCYGIVINYSNLNDYLKALEDEKVIIYNSELRKASDPSLYDGVFSRKYTNDNTVKMSNDEVKALFVTLYNTVYSAYLDPITNQGIEYNYKELKENASSIATKLFSLDENDYTYMATLDTVKYGTVNSVCYKISGEAIKDYSLLTSDEKDALIDDYLDEIISDTTKLNKVLNDFRSSSITFYDREFAFDYNNSYDNSYNFLNLKGDEKKIMKVNDRDITADQYYEFVRERNLDYYIFLGSLPEIANQVPLYSLLYGNEKDINKNASLRKADFANTLEAYIEKNYNKNIYGDLALFLYAKFGLNTKEDVLKYYYVFNDLEALTVIYNTFSETDVPCEVQINPDYSNKVSSVIDDLYDNFYSLYAYDLLIFTDRNNDYKRDDLSELSNTSELYDLINDLFEEIKAEIDAFDSDDDKSYQEISDKLLKILGEYNEASRDDAKYGIYKRNGIFLAYGNYNNDSAIDYSSYSEKLTDEMNETLKTIFNTDGYKNLKYHLNQSLTFDKDGAHITLTKPYQDKPSFKYELAEDSTLNPKAANDSDKPSIDQVANALYVSLYKSLLTSKDIAKSKFEIENFPKDFPTSLVLTPYVEKLTSYFNSDNFLNVYYASKFTGSETILKYLEIYDYYLNLE